MANLTRLYEEFVHPKTAPFVITTKRGTHEVGTLHASGDIANIYLSVSEGAQTITKITRSPKNSDLIAREVRALKKIKEDVDPKYSNYFPEILDVFKHRDAATRVDRRGVVMSRHMVGFTPLSEVIAATPKGLDPRDAAWMFRRLLVALGALHRAGVVHGAIAPQHMLMQLEQHGLVLVGYGTSVMMGEDDKVPALAKSWERAYPDEVVGVRATPTSSTDIYMAAKVMEAMVGDRAPRQIRAFLKACTQYDQDRRPNDAWLVLADFTALIERLYGPRRFRPFRMPATS